MFHAISFYSGNSDIQKSVPEIVPDVTLICCLDWPLNYSYVIIKVANFDTINVYQQRSGGILF